MSNADRIRLAIVEETEFGETPATPTMLEQRITSESIVQDTATTQSEEIRPDRQITDVLRTNINASGDIGIELSFEAHEALLLAALAATSFSAAVTTVDADTSISADETNNRLEGPDGSFTNYSAGQWVKIEGFANEANNGIAKIVAIGSSNPGVSDDDQMVLSHIELVDAAATPPISVTQLGSAVNGTVQKSFTIEKTFTDLSNLAHIARGMNVDQFDLSVAVEQIVTGSFSFLGKNLEAAAAPVGSSYTPAPTHDVMSAVDNVMAVFVDGEAAHGEGCATEFSMSLQNNLRARQCIGKLGAQSMGIGTFTLTGSLTRYFESNDEMNMYLDFERSSLSIIFTDRDGNIYIFDFPSVKYTSGQAVAGGQNTDIVAEMEWQAMRDPDEGITVRVSKLAA